MDRFFLIKLQIYMYVVHVYAVGDIQVNILFIQFYIQVNIFYPNLLTFSQTFPYDHLY
jgi:hypothetical protein